MELFVSSLLLRLEDRTGLTANQCSKLLGYARPTYYQYRRTDEMPEYAKRHVRLLLILPSDDLEKLVSEYVFDDEL